MKEQLRNELIEELENAIRELEKEKSSLIGKMPKVGDYFDEAIQIINNFIKDFDGLPRIAVIGSTGMGKSSLINHIFDFPIASTDPVKSETRVSKAYSYPETEPFVEIIDTRGLNEVFDKEAAELQLIEELSENRPHLLLYVTDGSNRASVDREFAFVRQLIANLKNKFKRDVGCVVFANKCDGISPSGFQHLPPHHWRTKSDNDSEKTVIKRENIEAKVDWLNELLVTANMLTKPEIVPIALQWQPQKTFWNQQQAMEKVFQASSPALMFAFGLAQKLRNDLAESLTMLCEEITIKFSIISALVCYNPFPVSDAIVLGPLQMAMVKIIKAIGNKGALSEWELMKFVGISSFAGKFTANQLLKLVPVLGHVINSGVASLLTYGVGQMAIAHFVKGYGKEQMEHLRDFTQFKAQVEEIIKSRSPK